MKASITNWIVSALLLVVGILSLVIVYQNVYQPMVKENEQLRADIKLIEANLAVQKGHKEKQEFYIAEAESLTAQAKEQLGGYPVDLWEEDHIAYVDYITDQTGMDITSLNWGTNADVKQLSNGMALKSESITFNYNRSYASLKDLIHFLVEDPLNHTSLTTLSISYNAQQDTMSGTMYVKRFYLTGQGTEHKPAQPGEDIETGQDNVLD
jgi:hypothetical protein